ncbi:MAG TPA: glycosyltransferase family 9 protein [Pseudonocardia sp.]|nr:glycosyltransferase family 9 protein [Pseudonocardia sp.]
MELIDARRDGGEAGIPSLLALRALNLGDLLVAVPALRALRRGFPRHRVVLATPRVLEPLVARSGAVDALLDTPEPAALRWSGPPPDVVVNLHGTGPQSHHALDALGARERIGFRAAGWDGPEWAEVAARHPHERERWCALLEHHGIPADPLDLALPHPLESRDPGARGGTSGGASRGIGGREPPADAAVLVHPGAAFGSKRWPAERYAAVAAALERAGRCVLVTGSAGERPLAAQVAGSAGLAEDRVLAGRTDLDALCRLVARAALVVSGDTGIAHLASAFGTPSVVLFGPVGPQQWGPPPDGPHVTLGDARVRRGERFRDDPDPALLAIDPAQVLRAAAQAERLGRCRGRNRRTHRWAPDHAG